MFTLTLRDFTNPFQRHRLRDVFPFLKAWVQDFECSVWVYWLIAACAIGLTATAIAWVIDKLLKWKGLK
jgi:hypothetical protein